jgi:hypothetical protein
MGEFIQDIPIYLSLILLSKIDHVVSGSFPFVVGVVSTISACFVEDVRDADVEVVDLEVICNFFTADEEEGILV